MCRVPPTALVILTWVHCLIKKMFLRFVLRPSSNLVTFGVGYQRALLGDATKTRTWCQGTGSGEQVKYQILFISKGAVRVYCQRALKEKRLPNPIDDKRLGSAVEKNCPGDVYLEWGLGLYKKEECQ